MTPPGGAAGLVFWAIWDFVALRMNQRQSIFFVFSTSGKNEMLNFKGMQFPVEVILAYIWWYAAYPLSTRHLEEMMKERGVLVDHSTVSRWAIRFLPLLEKIFRKHKRQVDGSWRMDETCIKVKGV